MANKSVLILVGLFFISFFGCQKATLQKDQSPLVKHTNLVVIPSLAVTPSLVATPSTLYIDNVPKDGVYYLCYINNYILYNYTSYKDSLIVKNISPNSVEITMHLHKTIDCFNDSCTVYTGNSKMLHYYKHDSLVLGDLFGKSYQYNSASFMAPPTPPIRNIIQNLRTQKDTLQFNLDYEYLINHDGKTGLRYGPGKLLFVKAH